MSKRTTTNKYDFKKDVQELFTKREKVFKARNGNEYTFKFDNYFSDIKKQALYDNYVNVVRECKKQGENIEEEVLFINLIVKYFTNVYLDETGKELYTGRIQNIYKKTQKELSIAEELVELRLYGQIINELDPKEINELKVWIENMSKNLIEISKYIEEAEEKNE